MFEKVSIHICTIVSLAISPFFNIDSIALPKFTVFVMYGCVGFFYILYNLKNFLLVNYIVKLIAVPYVILIFINLLTKIVTYFRRLKV